MKSTTDEIRVRFDNDVERFSNADTGQTATMDSALALSLIEKCIVRMNPKAETLCDIGCGAGNFSLRVVRQIPGIACTLIDLSKPMLDRAVERITNAGGNVEMVLQEDIRTVPLKAGHYDIIIAAAVLHHLRSREEWNAVLLSIFNSLKKGGTFWMWDLIRYD